MNKLEVVYNAIFQYRSSHVFEKKTRAESFFLLKSVEVFFQLDGICLRPGIWC